MKEFIYDCKKYSVKIGIINLLICFVKWITGAKRITLQYKK